MELHVTQLNSPHYIILALQGAELTKHLLYKWCYKWCYRNIYLLMKP